MNKQSRRVERGLSVVWDPQIVVGVTESSSHRRWGTRAMGHESELQFHDGRTQPSGANTLALVSDERLAP